MAFKRSLSDTFSAPVEVNTPNAKGGFDKSTFTAVFKRPTTDEQKRLRQLTNEDLLRECLVGWDMTDDETKASVPFSSAELDAVLLISPTPLATALAFWESLNGARSKNS
jgi:hypothetical protein